MNKKQRFLETLKDPEGLYLREGVRAFKDIIYKKMFNYTAEYVPRFPMRPQSEKVYVITVQTDDQDALQDLDKDFVLCFANVMHRAWIQPMQHSDTFERRFILNKHKERG